MTGLSWDHTEDIAIELYETFPDLKPLEVRFTELHKLVSGLKDFAGDPSASTESKLEAIQMAWYEEWKENQ